MNFSLIRQSLRQMRGVVQLSRAAALPDIEGYCAPMDFSLPFHGCWLVANGGVTPETSHSWEIPQQRYAYDFLIVDESGQHFSGDEKDPAAYYCYGREILAPADGFVVALYADAPDNPINKRRPVCAADDLRGNFVLLNHGSGVYSLLCHLKPGSIYVHVGQAVARGERIARCGNSGNTTEPHLHFQLQAGRDFCTAPSLPIPFAHIGAAPSTAPHFPPYIERGMIVWNERD